MRFLVVLLLAICGGCESGFARRVRELAPQVRGDVASMRGMYPNAAVEVLSASSFAREVLHRLDAGNMPDVVACYCPDGVIRLVDWDLDEGLDDRLLLQAEAEIAGLLAHEFTHELQLRRGALNFRASHRTTDAAWLALEGEASLTYLMISLRRSGDPSFARVGRDPCADRRMALRLECEACQFMPEMGPLFTESREWAAHYRRVWGPYDQGLRSALQEYLAGGWPAVARAADAAR
jgi:hypothetical protein